MTGLLNFTRTQERRRKSVSMCASEWRKKRDLYSSGRESMNERSFNEG